MKPKTIRRLRQVRTAVRVLIHAAAQLLESEAPSPSPSPSPNPKPSSPPTYPAQIVIYGPDDSTIVEGTCVVYPDGSIGLDLPLTAPPTEGTTVQLILYTPEDPGIIEGFTGPPDEDGSFDIYPID